MTYNQTLQWLFQQLPMYQNQGKKAYKADLSNTQKLATYLNYPEHKFKSIHVGGTNGKGSTSHMLASILQEANYKVGLYTSPHLKDFRERIRINGQPVEKDFVIDFIKQNQPFFETHQLSFFEMTVGMAFQYFAQQKVDIAIIEVGLGGRLDSTNIITPLLSIITNIGFDHMEFLGHTRSLIAKEKAGIIKPNIPVVIGETHHETKTVFIEKALSTSSEIFFADTLVEKVLDSDLKGSYQHHNIKTVIQAINVLNDSTSFKISEIQLKKGLLNVVKNTGLLGRWQVLSKNPKIICDTAHNVEGLTMVMQQLNKETFEKLHIVFGMVKDKNLEAIMPLLPKTAKYYLAKPKIHRGLDTSILAEIFNDYDLKYIVFNSVIDAFNESKNRAHNTDVIFVGGSTFVVAEVL